MDLVSSGSKTVFFLFLGGSLIIISKEKNRTGTFGVSSIHVCRWHSWPNWLAWFSMVFGVKDLHL